MALHFSDANIKLFPRAGIRVANRMMHVFLGSVFSKDVKNRAVSIGKMERFMVQKNIRRLL